MPCYFYPSSFVGPTGVLDSRVSDLGGMCNTQSGNVWMVRVPRQKWKRVQRKGVQHLNGICVSRTKWKVCNMCVTPKMEQ